MTPGRSGREAHVSENPWAACGTHRGKAGGRMWQRPHGGARRNHAGSHRHRHGVDMVADPVLGLFIIVLGVLAWVVFETSIQSVLRAVVEIIFG